jgi:sterol desaturase/sphingolipid hydroxylase (fatty acid hydroxylase superfamily)
MHLPSTLGRALFGLVLLGLVFMVIERWLSNRPRLPLRRRGWLTDVVWFLYSALIAKPITFYLSLIPFVLLVILGVTDKEGLQDRSYRGFGPIGAQPLWLQTVELYLVADFLGYWSHRLFHRRRLWPFHAVHHSTQDLDWLASVRVHPVNDLVGHLVQTLPLVLLGFNPWVATTAAPFLTFYAIFLHANVDWGFGPLRYVIATPLFHRWHHSRQREAWDKNFAGLFPIWDLIFGTLYLPAGKVPEDFGIDDTMPESWLGQMWRPFVWNRAKGPPPP